MHFLKRLLFVTVVFVAMKENIADKPCAAAKILGDTVVCVCNTTYCDTLTWEIPNVNSYISYTSSMDGLRFKKNSGNLHACGLQYTPCGSIYAVVKDGQVRAGHRISMIERCEEATLTLDTKTQYQEVEGFGGAVTDAAGINWRSLSSKMQGKLIDAYFSVSGIGYSMVRVPVGGTDFSERPYAYNELPSGDAALSNYSLTYEDYRYKLPMLRAANAVSHSQVLVVAAVWSPPPWMKTNRYFTGYSHLQREYYCTYVKYYYKFIEEYEKERIQVWAITTTNEPTTGVIPTNHYNSLGWTAESMGHWIAYYLGPQIRNSSFSGVKILAGDDQRATLPYWITQMLEAEPEALDYIDGVSVVHSYTDYQSTNDFLDQVMAPLPGKFLLASEAGGGFLPEQRMKVQRGSWGRAYTYIHNIIADLNHNAVGWLDRNLCLNAQGGPNWAGNYADSPITVMPKEDSFVKEPTYYAIGHFSKFIPRGSQRIRVLANQTTAAGLEHVAFLTPRGTAVLVFYNSGEKRTVNVRVGSELAEIVSEADSVTTVEILWTGQ